MREEDVAATTNAFADPLDCGIRDAFSFLERNPVILNVGGSYERRIPTAEFFWSGPVLAVIAVFDEKTAFIH